MSDVVSLFFRAMSISPMSHVDFKKWLCSHVKFRDQGPYSYYGLTRGDHVCGWHSGFSRKLDNWLVRGIVGNFLELLTKNVTVELTV